MSGGPVFEKKTNKILGIITSGEPEDKHIKDVLFAVDCTELIKIIK